MSGSATEVLIVGAGMAGASLAAAIAPTRRVVLLEQEAQAGRHATGRSAALFTELYGNSAIRALTRASRPFLEAPPSRFSATPLLTPRGCLYLGGRDDAPALERLAAEAQAADVDLEVLDAAAVRARLPIVAPTIEGALLEPASCDIDVDALHQGYLRAARAAGARLALDDALVGLERARGAWTARTAAGEQYSADIVVNAAGAWADEVAAMAGATSLGLRALRRTAALIDAPEGADLRTWPAAIDVRERYYFKPEAGLVLVSPADETPQTPGDAAPEEIDIAIALDRLEAVTSLRPRRVRRSWAGLRTFAPDRTPVVGFDPHADGFFWLAGQGGYGIQTAPALAALAAALIAGTIPSGIELDRDLLAPGRWLPPWPNAPMLDARSAQEA